MIAVNRVVMRNRNIMTKITTKIRSTTTILIIIDDQDHPLANREDRQPVKVEQPVANQCTCLWLCSPTMGVFGMVLRQFSFHNLFGSRLWRYRQLCAGRLVLHER